MDGEDVLTLLELEQKHVAQCSCQAPTSDWDIFRR